MSKEFEKLVEELMEEDKWLLARLADDTKDMEAIMARDGCAFCGGRIYPCPCMNRDRNF